MTQEKIKQAIREATRFVERATELLAAQQDVPLATWPKESGAVRRASMELTRSLAAMRSRG